MKLNRLIAATTLVAAALLAVPASAQYLQLIDLPTLNGGDGTSLNSATIVGSDAFAVLSGGGNHRVVKVADIGGANTVTTLVSTADWNTAVGSVPTGIAGVPYASGSDLLILDIVTDQVVKVDQGTGAASLLVDNATIGGSVTFGGIDPSDGNLLVYQSSDDVLLKTTGAVNGITTVLTDTELTTITGDDTPSGVAADASGVIYLGQGTNSAGEDISFFDPSGPSSGTILTEEQIAGVGNDVGFSTTAFDFIDGKLVFRDGGTNDSIKSVDPANALATLTVELDEATLVAGPAASDFVNNFTSFNGALAWVQTLGSGGQVAGIYAIPEPSSLVLLGLGTLFAATRKRS